MVKEYTRPQHGNALYTLAAVKIGKAVESGRKVARTSKGAAPDGEYTAESGSGSTVLDGFAEKFAGMDDAPPSPSPTHQLRPVNQAGAGGTRPLGRAYCAAHGKDKSGVGSELAATRV